LRGIATYAPTGSFITAGREVTYNLRGPGWGRMLQLTVYAFVSFSAGAWIFAKLSPRFAEEM
jgi:hypothetical protein